MVALTRVVINNVEHYGDSCFVKSLDHFFEFEMLPIVIARTPILGMRREKVQRHVTPIIPFVRVALKYRHQFDNRYPELLQIRNLVHQSGVGAGTRRMYARIRVFREAPYMELVDDCFGFGARCNISGPIELDSMPGQHSQRRFSGIGAGHRGQLAVKLWREENTLGIGIEQNFLRIEVVKFRNNLPRDRVGIITSSRAFP